MLAGHSVTSNSVSRECDRNISGRCELLELPMCCKCVGISRPPEIGRSFLSPRKFKGIPYNGILTGAGSTGAITANSKLVIQQNLLGLISVFPTCLAISLHGTMFCPERCCLSIAISSRSLAVDPSRSCEVAQESKFKLEKVRVR